MEPKFQSSFIPSGPASSVMGAPNVVRAKPRDLVSFLAVSVFTISLILAGGVFLYKLYLDYSIKQMGYELESSRAALEPQVVMELTRLSGRLVTVRELLRKHQVLTPVFAFLETSTPATVRYNDFNFSTDSKGIELRLRGEARGYEALAFLSDLFNKDPSFKNVVFSDLRLDDKGNVVFALSATVDRDLVSYERVIKQTQASAVVPAGTSTPALTATSTPAATKATTTKPAN